MSAKIDKETNIGYNKMNCADLVRARMKDTGTALHELAEKMGYSRQRLGNRLLRNSLTAEEFYEAMAIMGATVKIEKNDGQQNLLWERTPSVGPRRFARCATAMFAIQKKLTRWQRVSPAGSTPRASRTISHGNCIKTARASISW